MVRLAALIAVTLAAAPAFGAATDWQELAPNVRARLISSGEISNGKMLAGLELDMPQSTNTYWRIPGETGIPTVVDLSGSTGVASASVQWPFPLIEDNQGYRDFVYRGPTVLPIELRVGEGGGTLSAKVALGICEEMCVPAGATFTMPLDGKADPGQSLRIKQALAQTPIGWTEQGAVVGAVTVAPHGIELHDVASDVDPSQLIADAGDPTLLFGAPQKSPQGAIWTLPLLGGADGSSLAGRTVEFTFMTKDGAYSASAVVGPARN